MYSGEMEGRGQGEKVTVGATRSAGNVRTERWVRLRAEIEPDNFCYSHRCTSYVRLGQGRAGASNTSASRYFTTSCFYAPPCGEASFGSAQPCIASALQNRLLSNIESGNRQFLAPQARERLAFRSTDATSRDEFQGALRLQRSSIVSFRICDMMSRVVKSNV